MHDYKGRKKSCFLPFFCLTKKTCSDVFRLRIRFYRLEFRQKFEPRKKVFRGPLRFCFKCFPQKNILYRLHKLFMHLAKVWNAHLKLFFASQNFSLNETFLRVWENFVFDDIPLYLNWKNIGLCYLPVIHSFHYCYHFATDQSDTNNL